MCSPLRGWAVRVSNFEKLFLLSNYMMKGLLNLKDSHRPWGGLVFFGLAKLIAKLPRPGIVYPTVLPNVGRTAPTKRLGLGALRPAIGNTRNHPLPGLFPYEAVGP